MLKWSKYQFWPFLTNFASFWSKLCHIYPLNDTKFEIFDRFIHKILWWYVFEHNSFTIDSLFAFSGQQIHQNLIFLYLATPTFMTSYIENWYHFEKNYLHISYSLGCLEAGYEVKIRASRNFYGILACCRTNINVTLYRAIYFHI